jgi:hypothetical protein
MRPFKNEKDDQVGIFGKKGYGQGNSGISPVMVICGMGNDQYKLFAHLCLL